MTRPPVKRSVSTAADRRAPAPLTGAVASRRRYEVSAITESGALREFSVDGPAGGAFLETFGVIARGAILNTPRGETAIEDLGPGDKVLTSTGRAERILWRGAMLLNPAGPDTDARLIRAPADSFGPGRPATDTVFGPAAQRVLRSPHLCGPIGAEAVRVPLSAGLEDGTLIAIYPVAPIHLFQLGFQRQHGVIVSGIEVASLLPQTAQLIKMSDQDARAFVSLFPQFANLTAAGRAIGPQLAHDHAERRGD